MTSAFTRSIAGCLICLACSGSNGLAEETSLGGGAYKLLKAKCYDCHGGSNDVGEGFDVTQLSELLENRGRKTLVVSGDPDASLVWKRVAIRKDMPPESEEPLSEEEMSTLERWIKQDTPRFEKEKTRQIRFITELQVLEAVAADLKSAAESDRPHLRYLSLAHLYNNPRFSELDLRLHRAAVSKTINSVSHETDIVLPKLLGPEEMIMRIDIRNYGWEPSAWFKLVKRNPYATRPTGNLAAVDRFNEISDAQGGDFDGVAYLRADWFVREATRPPIYHELAGLPETLDELLDDLGIDFDAHFAQNKLVRAGMFKSGISNQNRVVDYMRGRGDFWLSYDFASNAGRANIAVFPLGPEHLGSDFNRQAFRHDGGEVVFELDNGLHGYLIVDASGNRIDFAPVHIVYDKSGRGRSPIVTNGVSCIGCHTEGVKSLKDRVRIGHSVFATEARRKVRDLYHEHADMEQLVQRGRQRYTTALKTTIGPLLQIGDDQDRDAMIDFPEPVTHVVRIYDDVLDLNDVANELSIARLDQLKAILQTKPFLELGLGPLLQGGSIQRDYWASDVTHSSIYQEVLSRFGHHTPVN